MDVTLEPDKLSLLSDRYHRDGFIYLPANQSLIPNELFVEIQRLSLGALQDPEARRIFDPSHKCVAFPIIEDAKEQKPAFVAKIANEIVEAFSKAKLTDSAAALVDPSRKSAIYLRRSQINTLSEGDCIHEHLDTSANPCYSTGLILCLGDEYTGGEVVLYNRNNNRCSFRLEVGDSIFLDSSIPHQITDVHSGLRITIANFWGSNTEVNRLSKFASARAFHDFFKNEDL